MTQRTASLKLQKVGYIEGQFTVARYQRGYRWTAIEVKRLLDDIFENGGKQYVLQPVVVKDLGGDRWELIDGQQRLTTLYLIFSFMEREGLQNASPPFSVTYETRADCITYMEDLGADRHAENVDFFHLYTAYETIRHWFAAHKARRQHVANNFYGYLFDHVVVIWYEAPPSADAVSLFTRLNVGRIPLTDAELFKAYLLSQSSHPEGRDRRKEYAVQWDLIERDLRDPDVWAFIAGTRANEMPTRISLLLDALANEAHGDDRSQFHTFETLQKQANEVGAEAVWNGVLELHSLVLEWFGNRKLYHQIGYLIAIGHSFIDLVQRSRDRTKSQFEATLTVLIQEELDLSPADVTALSYETDAGYRQCEKLLLLMNVETIARIESSSEKYSFRAHKNGAWSLEHIHAQNAESLTKEEQWRDWLRLHRAALADTETEDPIARKALIDRIDSLPQVDGQTFQVLASEIGAHFTQIDQSTGAATHSVHSISNLALLSVENNSALGNAVFEVKRRRILELDKAAAYIPICTRNVFLKYYTRSNAQQGHFWSMQDREFYLQAMIGEAGILRPYLKEEEHAHL
ncbi:DUF262 domain-containing protein [Bradyrhizobium sp. AUGA SZCCT0042]|uniref:DUF262 domain-containing protein n=1 Tax=Bradyrhizobium sp. AUGA SZCCT0042 TaxID=2807651 RepID=UPI001BAD90FE|nr:DUF262 domain-containing protein [Bradyrhizobium sp. AUGA SZCCT0042]MBR1296627.1 DUF262 domain-containing protein [Bradyrhizobium sp. AUGA SZCCT0042]